ncbi:MAG: hypothetical protein KAS95_06095 [Candidatus Heimdallarchaeota archaeon]|nr:hypothetical protein [Candidatus Heimdallarchaeota archaeon]
MKKISLETNTTEEIVTNNLNLLLRLSALKASKILEDLDVFTLLNRPRSPEEIFHMLNFNTLDHEFQLLYEILAEMGLLTKHGEFYSEPLNRIKKQTFLETELEENENELIKPFYPILDKISLKYKAIIKGEYGKLYNKEFLEMMDSLYGSEFFFQIRELMFKSIATRLPIFDRMDKVTVLNFGVGSGYEALHIADFFGEKVSMTSIEPDEEINRCFVLQDLYEIYNVDFIKESEIDLTSLENKVDLLIINRVQLSRNIKKLIPIIQQVLNEEGYLTISFLPQLSLALDWGLGIYRQNEYLFTKDEMIAKLKHFGFSRMKFIGMNNDFVALQKS